MVVLRFQRRGSSRFWAAPAQVALSLLPGVVGAGVTALLLRDTLKILVRLGAGGPAALAAGSAEALAPLLVGLVVVMALVACGLLITGIGSARVPPAGAGGAGLGWGLLAAAVAALLLASGLVVLVVRMVSGVNEGPGGAEGLLSRLNVSLACAAVVALLLLVIAIVTLVGAPRSASTTAAKLGALSALALCGAIALVGFLASYREFDLLTATAMTGVPRDELPEPAQMATADATPPSASQAVPPPPPPPPPPDRRTRSATRADRGVPPDDAAGRGVPAAVRVGGTIREPRKLKQVNPMYPEIAKQARVQGVVILECTISPQGNVSSVRVLRGIPLLDAAAVDAVRQWVYSPTLLNGVPVPVIMTVTVNFKLSPG
jgi:protein TonB